MPIVPPALGNPYPTVGQVMNVARARVNDMINDINGDLLTNDAPYSQTYLTAAWNWYQAELSNAGVETFKREVTLSGVPARSTDDPVNQCYISWEGCSDGVFQYEGPVLPQDMILPLSVWRRQTQIAPNIANFLLMTASDDGLPRFLATNQTDWREDGLYFYGERWAQDFQIRYAAYRAPLDITMPDSLVPMMMCEDCLGARVGFEFASARGSAQADKLEQWSMNALNATKLRSSRRKGRKNIRRRPYSGRGSWGCGNVWPVIR